MGWQRLKRWTRSLILGVVSTAGAISTAATVASGHSMIAFDACILVEVGENWR